MKDVFLYLLWRPPTTRLALISSKVADNFGMWGARDVADQALSIITFLTPILNKIAPEVG